MQVNLNLEQLFLHSSWMGNQAWTEALEWPGAKSFHAAEHKEFKVKSESGGVYKSAEGLTYMRVPFLDLVN
jgi:cathepsin A (carboxypeptidase C)